MTRAEVDLFRAYSQRRPRDAYSGASWLALETTAQD
jgi:hypothetical protein